MKVKIILLFIVFLNVTFGLFAQKKWTLEQCVNTALTNNLDIKQQKLISKSKEIEYRQAKNNLLPNLNGNVGQTFTFGRSLTSENSYINANSQNSSLELNTSLMLFDGLKMKYDIEVRKIELLQSKSDLKIVEKDIILNVSIVFLQVLQNKELLKNAENQISITQQNIERIKELVKSGKLAEGEIYELQAQLAKEELIKVRAENKLKLSLLDLSQIMNLNNDEGEKIKDIIYPEELYTDNLALLSIDEIYENALKNRPEIQSVKYQLQNNSNYIKIAKSYYMPYLSLGANWQTGYYYTNNNKNNFSFIKQFNSNMQTGIRLDLAIPIFNKFKTKNNIEKLLLDKEKNENEMLNVKKALRKKIEQYYYNAIAAQKHWKTTQKAVKASEVSYHFILQKFKVGKANQYEVNSAKNNLSQAILEQTQAKYEYAFQLKLLNLMK